MEESSVWGLELGQEGLTAVSLCRREGRVEAERHFFILHEKTRPTPQTLPELWEQSLRRFAQAQGLAPGQPVAVAMSGLGASSLPVRLPPISRRLEELVQLEIHQTPPIPDLAPEDTVYRFQLLPTDSLEERRIFLVAYPRELVESTVAAVRRTGLAIRTLQSGPACLVNLLRFELRDLNRALVVQLRRDGTDLLFGTEAGIWFRSIPEGGLSIRDHLRNVLGVPAAEADEILGDFFQGIPRPPYTIACDEFLDRVQHEIQRALDYQALNFSFSRPEKVYVLGDSARIPGVLTHFSSHFHCWVERLERSQRIAAGGEVLADLPGRSLYGAAAAVGAALQGLGAVEGAPSFAEPVPVEPVPPALLVPAPPPPGPPTHARARGGDRATLVRAAGILLLLGSAVFALSSWIRSRRATAERDQAQTELAQTEAQLEVRREFQRLRESLELREEERAALECLGRQGEIWNAALASLLAALSGEGRILAADFRREEAQVVRGTLELALHGDAEGAEARATADLSDLPGVWKAEARTRGSRGLVVDVEFRLAERTR